MGKTSKINAKRQFDLVLFGSTGDLALLKLIPSIYRAFKEGDIDARTRLFFCCRKEKDFLGMKENLYTVLKANLESDEYAANTCADFLQLVIPIQINLQEKGSLASLQTDLQKEPDRIRVFYLAVPPSSYGDIANQLHQYTLITSKTRLVIEKPIGHDLVSSKKLNDDLSRYFNENQIYRIDHYLGKETVQNLLALRFSNTLFQRIWHADAIDHIQISINESVGVNGRAGYYEGVGALKDMVQNHLLQLLCMIAMESPNQLTAEAIHQEKIKVLKALRPLTSSDVDTYTVRGQYVSGTVNGHVEKGYLDDINKEASTTETFVAIKAFVDSWHWSNIPFYLRTGKRLKRRSAEIVIQFKPAAHQVFPEQSDRIQANRMIIQLQPKERLQLIVMTNDMSKVGAVLKPAVLDLNFTDQIKGYRSYAYKRLFLDAVDGNQTLFIHKNEVEAAWAWIDPIVEHWKENENNMHNYQVGTSGPDAANRLIEKDGRHWIDI